MDRRSLAPLVLCASLSVLLAGFRASGAAPVAVSDPALQEDGGSASRRLLQAKQSCPVNFESLNYTIITSQCKGPRYPADLCCAALKELACPYTDQINDLKTDCATAMFSYINLYGKYPPAVFANECREGKLGLACTAAPPPAADSSAAASGRHRLLLLALSAVAALMVLGFLLSP